MQDPRSITSGGVAGAGGGGGGGAGGGSSRIFGGGDRRLRPYPNQPLKCPRCDSLNTKFCYYNNYNLSQPRHFCKSCRRYWTKGGVLRNVPVGGGCRKTKRSNKPKQTSAEVHKERKSTTTSHSSSDSSGLTAATTTSTNPCTTEVATSGSSATTGVLATCFPDSSHLVSQSPNPNLEQPSVLENLEKASSDGGGVFAGLMAAVPNPALVGYNFSSANQLQISPFRLNQHHDQEKQHHHHHQQQQQQMEDIHDQLQEQEKIMMIEELKMQELTVGCVDQTATAAAAMELSMPGAFQKRMNNNGELTVSEWQLGSGDHSPLFDLPSTVDQEYWSQSQWPDHDQDHDHHMYLP